jgi:antitoxin CptB
MDFTEILRKKLRHQCWYRGCTESDRVLGGFADGYVAYCTLEELHELAKLLEEDDRDIWRWISGQEAPPERHKQLINKIIHYSEQKHHEPQASHHL